MSNGTAAVETSDDRARAIERLQKSKEEHEERLWERGRKEGHQWAMNDAEAGQLKRLSDTREAAGATDWPKLMLGPGRMNLYFMMDPDYDGNHGAARDFWEQVLGEASHLADDATFVDGFAHGAIEFFEEIEAELF